MYKPDSYKIRPLYTTSGVKRKRLKETLFLAMQAVGKLVPDRIAGVFRRSCQLMSDERVFAVDQHPIVGMMVESVEIVPENEQSIVSKLTDSFKKAKTAQSDVSSPYQPGAGWKDLLEEEWREYLKAIDQSDIGVVSKFLRNFFRNEGLSGFWGGKQMFESFAAADNISSIRRAFIMRKQFEAWREALPDAPVKELKSPLMGNPWGYMVEGTLVIEPALEYHYQANYFSRLLSTVHKPVILEIGGGYGGLAYQILKQIPEATYIGFDLPENIFIQSYYLTCAFPDLKILTFDKDQNKLTHSMIEEYDIILMPNFVIPQTESRVADLVVNVRSLSEMPYDTIEEYLKQIDRISKLFFFHENIFKERRDKLHGIPSSEFPQLSNHILVSESESRWPRYQEDSVYPCHEYLYLHKNTLKHFS